MTSSALVMPQSRVLALPTVTYGYGRKVLDLRRKCRRDAVRGSLGDRSALGYGQGRLETSFGAC